ncbi:glycosyl hydrolase family 8 [uncultured Cedecea sp.]|uniref:glycosyl hydrolase family 8 n=1 Tax=uncultured Cedecea sp. TaxID=988762 RepID=UPI0026220AEC|nr:glycosyl hydrolase family 8 [uncultured Cedecea sp.]
MRTPFRTALILIMTLLFSVFAQADQAWDIYKARFLMPDGRIIDTGNNNISHSEGQGFAMLGAVANNDREAFDKLWLWTKKTLQNKESGLFYWRYNPASADPIVDKNNATDGDTLIAWALLQAETRWQDKQYGKASDQITKALLAHMVIDYAGYKVMLPGKDGFNHNSEVILNPSYFVFPAWNAFAKRSHLQIWQILMKDSQTLLSHMGQGVANLPTDWVALRADGQLSPATAWPPRMSYDAIRIPLYLYWYDKQSPLLQPWHNWFSQFNRLETPAWVNVVNDEKAPYMMAGGLLAVRDLTMGVNLTEPEISTKEDYYSASLSMLVWLAYQSSAR